MLHAPESKSQEVLYQPVEERAFYEIQSIRRARTIIELYCTVLDITVGRVSPVYYDTLLYVVQDASMRPGHFNQHLIKNSRNSNKILALRRSSCTRVLRPQFIGPIDFLP